MLERVIASFGNKRTKELSLYHHRLGRALATLGDKDVALTQLDMAFKIDPGSVEVLRDLGVLALETNDLDRAQKTFRALLLQRLDAQSGISKGEVFYYLGEISMKQGDKAKAVQMLERAVENEPALARAKTMLVGARRAELGRGRCARSLSGSCSGSSRALWLATLRVARGGRIPRSTRAATRRGCSRSSTARSGRCSRGGGGGRPSCW